MFPVSYQLIVIWTTERVARFIVLYFFSLASRGVQFHLLGCNLNLLNQISSIKKSDLKLERLDIGLSVSGPTTGYSVESFSSLPVIGCYC